MPVCSYLVVPQPGAADSVAQRLSDLPGCDVARAENRDVLLLVTDTPGPDEDARLREVLETMEGIQALVLSFGEIDPETSKGDPLARDGRRRRRPLAVVDPSGIVSGSDAPERSSYLDES
jgi:nitrate reductase NapAB chaperone NapD